MALLEKKMALEYGNETWPIGWKIPLINLALYKIEDRRGGACSHTLRGSQGKGTFPQLRKPAYKKLIFSLSLPFPASWLALFYLSHRAGFRDLVYLL